MALVPVRLPVPHRPAAGRAGHPGGGGPGGRRHPDAAFRYVVLPQLLPTIAVLAVLRFIWTFNSFDDIYLLTGGGAGTEVVSVSVFNSLTARGDIGGAAAQALVLAAILAVLVGLYLWRFAPGGAGLMATAPEQERRSTQPARNARASGWTATPSRRQVFGVLRWVVIVLLLLVTLFPFYYTVLLSLRPLDGVLQDPGASCVPPTEMDARQLRARARPARAGRAGLPDLHGQQRARRARHRGAHPARRAARCVRREPAASSSAAARSARCSWPSTCSRPSCSPSRCSCSSPGSGCAARWSAC